MTSVERLIVAITLLVALWYIVAVLADYVEAHRRRKARASDLESINDIRISCARDHRSLMADDSLSERQLAELCRRAALRRLSIREWSQLQQQVCREYPTTLRPGTQGYQDWLLGCMVIAAKRAIKS